MIHRQTNELSYALCCVVLLLLCFISVISFYHVCHSIRGSEKAKFFPLGQVVLYCFFMCNLDAYGGFLSLVSPDIPSHFVSHKQQEEELSLTCILLWCKLTQITCMYCTISQEISVTDTYPYLSKYFIDMTWSCIRQCSSVIIELLHFMSELHQ